MGSILGDNTTESSSLSVSATGMTIVRRILVKDIVVSGGNYFEAILQADKVAGVPSIGEAYPVSTTSEFKPQFQLVCISKEIETIDGEPDKFAIVCTYGVKDASKIPAQKQYYPGAGDPFPDRGKPIPSNYVFPKKVTSSTLVTEKTNELYGEQLVESPSNPPVAGDYSGKVTVELFREYAADKTANKSKQTAVVDVQRPSNVIQYKKHEYATLDSIGAHDFLGYMNSKTFGIYNRRTVLFSNINYEPVAPDASGKWTYITTYTFQVATLGSDWTKEIIYTDPGTKQPLAGADNNYETTPMTDNIRTKKTFLTYQEVDFHEFGLEENS